MSKPPPAWPPLGLSRPAQRALANAGILSLTDLARHSEKGVASLHGMGPTGIVKLKDALTAGGLAFTS